MTKEQQKFEDHRKLYSVPGGAPHQLRSKNAIYISPSNNLRHEIAKALGGYMIRKWGDIFFNDEMVDILQLLEKVVKRKFRDWPTSKTDFITEAIPKSNPDRRVDLINLRNCAWIEFETDSKIEKQYCLTIRV